VLFARVGRAVPKHPGYLRSGHVADLTDTDGTTLIGNRPLSGRRPQIS